MTRIQRGTHLLAGLLVLLVLVQVRVRSSVGAAITINNVQAQKPETAADCGNVRARPGCLTIWEYLVCSPNNAYSAVVDAALQKGVDLAPVLDNPDTSLTLTVVNNTFFNNTGTWPGADIAPGRPPVPGNITDGKRAFSQRSNHRHLTTANGNPFDPVAAQMWFYYNILPGDYAPSDLLSANNTVRTALFYGYQNTTQTLGLANETLMSNPAFLAYNWTGVWPYNMTMTEGMAYPGSSPVSATVQSFETACNGHLYFVNSSAMRVLQVQACVSMQRLTTHP